MNQWINESSSIIAQTTWTSYVVHLSLTWQTILSLTWQTMTVISLWLENSRPIMTIVIPYEQSWLRLAHTPKHISIQYAQHKYSRPNNIYTVCWESLQSSQSHETPIVELLKTEAVNIIKVQVMQINCFTCIRWQLSSAAVAMTYHRLRTN